MFLPLQGHSQLMHMRITYLFLADLHITRHARKQKDRAAHPKYLNKPCGFDIIASQNRDYRPKVISEHSFFLYAIENSPMDFSRESQTSTNNSEFEESVEVRNDTKAEKA